MRICEMNRMRYLISLTTAVLASLPLSAIAGSWEDINQLSVLVQATGTEIVQSDCEGLRLGYYEYSDDKGIDRITLCTNRLDTKDHNAVWETLAHESTHVAQYCSNGYVFEAEYSPRIFRTIRAEAPHYAELLESYASGDKLTEAEAFYMELRPPLEVKKMIIDACEIDSERSDSFEKD